jgi:signal transduction histidine kinase/ActR/RegA family two-component response regulator
MKDGVMNRDEKRVSGHPNDNDGASETDDPGQPGVSSQHKDSLPAVLEKNSTHMESVIIDDEADLLSREKLVTAREDAAHLRENAADLRENAADLREDAAWLREGTATSREQEIRAAGTIQAASENHMIMLQQVNARLVIATIEAQKLAEQVQTAKAQLESAKHVAEKASLAKSDFLSSMSHELRTPLNAILGFAQLLEAGPPPPTAAQIVRLHQIIKAGWYLLELINEILDLAVIESGKLSLSREPVSLIDVMRECQAMVESQAQKHGIHINFLPFDNTWFANADRTRVKQILINLLSNAIKYNREHGTVEVKCISSNPERIHISIKDSGAGLPPEKLAQLFQPFNRLGQETGSKEGTGIGLVVTKLLVELMGGTIGVESTVGVGSEFWIELIRDVTPQLAGNKMPAELAPQAQENAPLRTLLYVEDNPANLMLVKQIIEGNPHLRILSARDGNLGIALARAHLPDVILMDINLPDISGIEALNILREDPATAHIPVVALSANAMLRDIEKGLEAGFFRYLTKPIKINEFMNALDEALKFSEMGLANTNETGEIR